MHQFDSIVLGSLDLAQSEALKRKHTELTPYHLFWGLLKHPDSHTSKAFKEHLNAAEKQLKDLPTSAQKISLENIRLGAELSEWITHASSNAIQESRKEISEKDLLRVLPQHLADYLPGMNLDFNKLSNNDDDSESEMPSFLIDLVELAKEGKLDPVIGRDKEIRSLMEILGRRGKNNPVLVGPAGVGKTAIVEGLADNIVKGKVPDVLKGKTIYSLDMGALMAGTKFRGEFEERLQTLLKFIKSKAGESILFIDEIHQLVGAGKTDGAMDAANLLKPALARGELHCIGATTEDEYQKYLLGDAALARRFRSVPVREPSVEDSIEILLGIKDKFEIHHGIKISDEAIYNAVLLSNQYITDKNLPDKAIDLIDEAASSMKLSVQALPPKLVEMEAEIRAKSIQLQVEKNNEKINNELVDLKEKFKQEKDAWDKEILAIKRVSELKNHLDRLKFDLDEAERMQNFEEAGKIKYSLIPEVEKELSKFNHDWVLSKTQVAQVIARQTGIPLEKILKTKQEGILNLAEQLKKRVFGQDKAIDEITGTLMSSYAGLTDETRPLGSFLLLGPSGVGKTETAKSMATQLFNSEEAMVRIDMSEYSEKHAVAKLIGAPAGYIGHDDGGVLTEMVRRRPYSVILFDEIEKAHPDFSDILLQILDDGRLTDNKGRTISFKNTIIFLTSNAKDYKNQFKPEVLGRIDAILEYQALTKELGEKIISKQLSLLQKRLEDKGVNLELSKEVTNLLLDQGIDETYGARPLQAVFNRIITRPLSFKILNGDLKEGRFIANYNKETQQVAFNKN